MNNIREPWLYLAPTLLFIFLMVLVPLVTGITYAFYDFDLISGSKEYVGFDQFKRILSEDALFTKSLLNTLFWTSASLFFQFTLGLLLALILNSGFKGVKFIQPVLFIPWAVPSFLIGLMWVWMFNPVTGPLPYLFEAVGILQEPENILSDPDLAMWGPITANVWFGIPFFTIMLLAALRSIPNDIYEAAQIDGISGFQAFRHITIPLIAPTIIITLLVRAIWIANFAEIIIVMTNGGPANSTQIVATYIYDTAYQEMDFGYASVISIALMSLLLVYGLILGRIRQRMTTYF
ncbi:carbohydrate ABC transporter permease [Pseudemcibacter aquimaris]|uniref:carbohydrate ABC transporter permease n=1 Tax=Pseudemcibacter aquimaris TaxID=2857064 RepID=UPI002013A0A2|nr:sugar ABC transporter permease [Pseudemcibacter aquimaris]MCC3862041.1 sugar ABC transporter permease [Pseudemcibacter aquimaris]WDU58793.1 sugar ABC transporter permease [Pseudemcibacter aquimaris]